MCEEEKTLVTDTTLEEYFYKELFDLNNSSAIPLPQPFIFYGSQLLNRYAASSEFFEKKDGRIREKIMGMKLLESYGLSHDQKLKEYREIGDYTLLLCGYFFDKFQRNRSIISKSYYQKIGQTAYRSLNKVQGEFLDMKDFYKSLANNFTLIAALFSRLSYENRSNDFEHHYLLDELDDKKAS